MSTTAIEWTDATWNPVTGCDRVSPGCAHCYALTLAARLKAMGQARYQRDGGRSSGPGFGVTLHPDKLEEPLRWRKPRRVFVNSMSDLFHEAIPDEYIARVFSAMANTPQHTYQVLTKRPERMERVVRRLTWIDTSWIGGVADPACWQADLLPDDHWSQEDEPALPLPNVWLGVSIENRRFVGRADLLRRTPAAVRFISAEPLLGPLVWDAGDGLGHQTDSGYVWNDYTGPQLDLTGIDWLIVGGESGADHRPCHESWVRDLRDAAIDNGTAFFFKQWGGRTPKAGGRELDGRTWDEMPSPSPADPSTAGSPPSGGER